MVKKIKEQSTRSVDKYKYSAECSGQRLWDIMEMSKDENHPIGDELRALRDMRLKNCKPGTINELAEFLKVDRTTASKWVNKAISTDLVTLSQICNGYGCDINYLLGQSDSIDGDRVNIEKELGLSPKALRILQDKNAMYKEWTTPNGEIRHGDNPYIDVLSMLIETDTLDSIVQYIACEQNDSKDGQKDSKDEPRIVNMRLKTQNPNSDMISLFSIEYTIPILLNGLLTNIQTKIAKLREDYQK